MTEETCETCTRWRTAVGDGRRICVRWGYVTGMEASCGFWAERLPFSDEPEEGEDEEPRF